MLFFKKKSGASADFFTALAIMVLRLEATFTKISPIKVYFDKELFPPDYYKDMEAEKRKTAKEKLPAETKAQREESAKHEPKGTHRA